MTIIKLTDEEFEAWRHSPLTQLIFDGYLADEMQLTRKKHDAAAWVAPLMPEVHASYRERWETLEWLRNMTAEELREWMEENRTK